MMTQQELKQKLLQTNCFENNEYLSKYCELVIENLETKREKGKTQCHHILPKCYFKHFNQEIDESSSNLVNLLYKNHILAHYYLAKSCNDKNLYERLNSAFIKMTFIKYYSSDNFDPKQLDDYQLMYEQHKHYLAEYNSKVLKGRNTWSKNSTHSLETREKQSKAKKGKPLTPEHNKAASLARTGLHRTPEQRLHQREAALNKDFNPENENKRIKAVVNAVSIKIICVETGEIFNSIKEAELKYYNKPCSSISNAIKKGTKCKGYHWCKLGEENNFVSRDNNRKNRKVKCIETGVIFDTIKEAQKSINNIQIGKDALIKGHKAGGYHWEYVNK